MPLPFVPCAIDVDDLEDWGIHNRSLENTMPRTYGKIYYDDAQGRENGIWECTPGKYRLERSSDEMCYILQGHWVLSGDEGDIYELSAGDMIMLKKGWCGISHIIEKVRKVYMES